MVTSDVLRTIIEQVAPQARDAGLVRSRGGITRGVSWAEVAGRGADRAWYELRLHHHRDGKLQAGMLAYRPLYEGGRTDVVGEISYDDASDPNAAPDMIEQILYWIDAASTVRPPESRQRS